MQASEQDTIAAIATAPGEGAIAIVRLSGSKSLELADAVFRSKGPRPSARAGGTFVYGHIFEKDGDGGSGKEKIVDEAVLLIFRAPHSYTREDVVEFQVHGGRRSAARVLRLLIQAGARMAEPGEFTRRAFLNGRIDLVQSEAVMDIIRAKSDRAALLAAEQMEGRLSHYVGIIYDDLLLAQADLEATLDFLEDDLEQTVIQGIADRIAVAERRMKGLLSSWNEGRILREGVFVVVAGRPNAGKSTLFNHLLEMDRSIVTRHPGTTRDLIEEAMTLNGYPIRLVDTAGIRETDCEIEAEGISRAQEAIARADILLYVIDASVGPNGEDHKVISMTSARKKIIILNKIDIVQPNVNELVPYHAYHDVVLCSLKTGHGVQEIREVILRSLSGMDAGESHCCIAERHKTQIELALESIAEAARIIQSGEEEISLSAACLRDALERIGSITGRVYYDSLLDSIFSRFCLGK